MCLNRELSNRLLSQAQEYISQEKSRGHLEPSCRGDWWKCSFIGRGGYYLKSPVWKKVEKEYKEIEDQSSFQETNLISRNQW